MKTFVKIKTRSQVFYVLILSILLGACATTDSLRPTNVGQKAEFKNVTKDQVSRLTSLVMSRQLTIIDTDKPLGMVRAESRVGMVTWGEVVAAYVTELPSGHVQLKSYPTSAANCKLLTKTGRQPLSTPCEWNLINEAV